MEDFSYIVLVEEIGTLKFVCVFPDVLPTVFTDVLRSVVHLCFSFFIPFCC